MNELVYFRTLRGWSFERIVGGLLVDEPVYPRPPADLVKYHGSPLVHFLERDRPNSTIPVK